MKRTAVGDLVPGDWVMYRSVAMLVWNVSQSSPIKYTVVLSPQSDMLDAFDCVVYKTESFYVIDQPEETIPDPMPFRFRISGEVV